MSSVFLFEIDGSLAEPGCPLSAGMAATLFDLACRHPVYLLSGGDWRDVSAQVPDWLRAEVQGIFVAVGTQFWRRDRQMAVRPPFPHLVTRGSASGYVAPGEWARAEVLPWLRSSHPHDQILVVTGRPDLPAPHRQALADALPVLGDGFNTVAVNGPAGALLAVADMLQDDDC
ncbi:MAG: hypothetical protein H6843_02060 [Rhodospirillaceae bacterium]|nr:hypothetical protein [Rhodospirillaceae bacterium]